MRGIIGIVGIVVLLLAIACVEAQPEPTRQQQAGPMIYEVLTDAMCDRLSGAAAALNAGLVNEDSVRQTVKELWWDVFMHNTISGDVAMALRGVDASMVGMGPLESKPYNQLEQNCSLRRVLGVS